MKTQITLVAVLLSTASAVLVAGPLETVNRSDPPPSDDGWSFNLTLSGWMTAVNGTITAADDSASVDIVFKDILDHLDMGFMGGAEVRYKRWGLLGDLLYARMHDDIAPPAGIVFSDTHEVIKETIGTLAVSYRVIDITPAYLDLFAGARVYNFYGQIRLLSNFPGQGVDNESTNTWVDPIIGVRGRYYIARAVFLNGYGDVGGFGVGSEISWQALGGFGVQAARWCDVQLGYRALGFQYENGTKQDIVTHGPIVGATFHF